MTKDDILRQCASIYTKLGSDSTKAERKEAQRQEWELLKKLKEIDPEEYEFYRLAKDK
jgi:hypothetical protein